MSVGILGGTIFNKSSPRHVPRRRRCGSSYRGGTSNKDSIRFLLSYSWTRDVVHGSRLGRRGQIRSWKDSTHTSLSFESPRASTSPCPRHNHVEDGSGCRRRSSSLHCRRRRTRPYLATAGERSVRSSGRRRPERCFVVRFILGRRR